MVQVFKKLTDPSYALRPGVDQARCRVYNADDGWWGEWTGWHTIEAARTIGSFIDSAGGPFFTQEWQFRRPLHVEAQPQPPEPEQPVLSPGSKYKRLLHQTLPEGHAGAAVIVDVYDVLRAWDVHCPAIQHAIKKLLQPGKRGSKSAAQDLREAIGSIERAIQLLGGG